MTRLTAVLIAILLLAGCAPKIEEEDAAALIRDVQPLFLRDLGEVPSDVWPASVAKLEPQHVFVKDEGLYIAIDVLFVQEQGLFVPRPGQEFVPSGVGSDPSYSALAHGIYSYKVKG